ncbi:hypothetical protein Taro_011445 [Colocasia esculenta]|uniref:CCHC-type domain-containing protein n=1 Tax=Colocasia esculenta TaxID=4460 RepID=A0A843U1H8_COLES|nr:hypothetical protein [Colocasia esculenta]
MSNRFELRIQRLENSVNGQFVRQQEAAEHATRRFNWLIGTLGDGHMRGECPELKRKLIKNKSTYKKPRAMMDTWSDEDKDEDAQDSSNDEEIRCLMARSEYSNERSCVVDGQGLPLSQSQRPVMWTSDVELSDRGSGRHTMAPRRRPREGVAEQATRQEVGDALPPQQTQPLPQDAHSGIVPPPPPPPQHRDAPVPQGGTGRVLREFLQFQPPRFLGQPDPDAARAWLDAVEWTFRSMECVPEERTVKSGSRRKFRRDRRQAEQRQQSVGSVQQPTCQPSQQVHHTFAGQCYRCDQMGHMARDCPLLPRVQQQQQAPVQQRQQTGGSGGSRGRGRVTHLTRADAEAAHLVEDSLGELSSGESVELAVELPTGDFVLTSYCLEEVPVQLQDQLLSARLFALQLHDYDVIFGMEWLERYGAVMDFQKKRVHLQILGEAAFYFQGILLLGDLSSREGPGSCGVA